MQLLGELDGLKISRPEVSLRKSNKIQTIQASLAIEGNTLSIDQVTDLVDGVAVLGPEKDILEVKNAIEVYNHTLDFNYASKTDFKKAHKILMKRLQKDAGSYRKTNVGVFAGSRVAHVAPQPKRVEALMDALFDFLKQKDDISLLIKSCVFHYELEFIHPFSDGNGRMGRLWQHLILSAFHEVFRYVAIESLIKERQKNYYFALAQCDSKGDSTDFIEFCLQLIEAALSSYAKNITYQPKTPHARLELAREKFTGMFSRQEYAALFKTISTATASRDLKLGVEEGFLVKVGDKRMTKYQFNQNNF
ncbi:Fic family protein [Candidiatus Paracoxiella cheracis]|uniref:Fic family protein n=1 Tax=Candidiatus Paracoxiella cheracis TaxID=3405120 RepID=UPI003BF48D48